MSANANTTSAELKIIESRAELERLLIDDPENGYSSSGMFPRSKTLQLVTSNRGIVFIAIAAGGLLLLRPTLIKRAMSVVPMGAVMRMVATRFMRNKLAGH